MRNVSRHQQDKNRQWTAVLPFLGLVSTVYRRYVTPAKEPTYESFIDPTLAALIVCGPVQFLFSQIKCSVSCHILNNRGSQRIVLVNYLFERPLIASDCLKRVVIRNFRDMRNLMLVVYALLKMLFSGTAQREGSWGGFGPFTFFSGLNHYFFFLKGWFSLATES